MRHLSLVPSPQPLTAWGTTTSRIWALPGAQRQVRGSSAQARALLKQHLGA